MSADYRLTPIRLACAAFCFRNAAALPGFF
jgi:hypothetical protein